MESKPPEVGRRKFMAAAIVTIGAAISAAVGLPAIAYLIGPAIQKKAEDWVRLAAINKVEAGSPTLFKAVVERQTGWINAQEEVSAYILTEDGQTFIAMSNICTHLGCRVRWIAEQDQFFCPCHNGVFSKDGAVVSGPPPAPLDRYETKIEDDVLFIRKALT
jgi:menaquinol-cytochrome c reductase iron-sulfur subunit